MIRTLFCIIGTCFLLAASSQAAFISFGVNGLGSGGDVPFTPTALYFMKPAGSGGSDAANGLTPATAWASPNHAVNCGDVILVSPGAYGTTISAGFGVVSSCPSAGGIYFAILLCAGSNVGDCTMSATSAGNAAMDIDKNNWAIEGWQVNGNGSARAFNVDACDFGPGTKNVNHVAIINSISSNTAQFSETDECANNHNIPGNGVDYWAIVGNIAQNSNQDGICLAAIDAVAPSNFDSNSGTHIYIAGNFALNNQVACNSDGEAFMFDTWDAHGYTGQGVITNNIAVRSARSGIQMFYQAIHVSAPPIYIYQNTMYGNNQVTGTDSNNAEILFQNGPGGTGFPWVVNTYNNIALTSSSTSPSGGSGLYAMIIGDAYANVTAGMGTSGTNIFKGIHGSCAGTCDAGNNVVTFNSGNLATLGSNTYTDPLFTNVSDLITNHMGAPNCSGFENVTQCMGWDARTSTLTSLSVISDLTATCGSCTGKGYQRPSATCVTDALYPTWLKGIVYLHATNGFTAGTPIVQRAGLVTRQCGL